MHRRQFLSGVGVAAGALAVGSAIERDTHALQAAAGIAQSKHDLEDLLVGSSYLGCGGGGSLDVARELIASDLENGLSFRFLDVEQLGDNDWVASPYALESLAPMSEEMRRRLDGIDADGEFPIVHSFRLLEEYLDQRFSAVIVGEIGPHSMAESISLAARLGVASLDADTVGRATPEINQHSVRVAGHEIVPAAAVTQFGDHVILKSIADPSREEDVFRALSVVSRVVGVTDAAIPGSVAKSEHVLVQGSLTLTRAIGHAVRQARIDSLDPVDAARQVGDGYKLFEGRVADFEWEDKDGFLVGHIRLAGDGDFAGRMMRLDYINEHLLATIDDDVVATCPDLITMVSPETHEGIGNPDFAAGQPVVVLAFPCNPLWRRPAGLAVFEPRYFGFDVDYVPVEQRLAM